MTPQDIEQAFSIISEELTDEQIDIIIAYAEQHQITLQQAITNILLLGKEHSDD